MPSRRRTHTFRHDQGACSSDTPARSAERFLNVLRQLTVRDVFLERSSIVLVSPAAPLNELMGLPSESTQAVFPVVDDDGRYVGIVSAELLHALAQDEMIHGQEIDQLAVAADCAVPFVALTPDDSLVAALERFDSSGCPAIPVVDSNARQRILGFVRYAALAGALTTRTAAPP